jgi:V-type H+-transporting ATPase subunit E
LTNKSRLRLLHRREEHLQDLFALARAQIARLAGDEARYVQFLEGVIVQGLLQLLEPSATVYARAKDVAIAARALDGAQKTYYDISGRQVELELDASLGDELYVGTSIVDSGSS